MARASFVTLPAPGGTDEGVQRTVSARCCSGDGGSATTRLRTGTSLLNAVWGWSGCSRSPSCFRLSWIDCGERDWDGDVGCGGALDDACFDGTAFDLRCLMTVPTAIAAKSPLPHLPFFLVGCPSPSAQSLPSSVAFAAPEARDHVVLPCMPAATAACMLLASCGGLIDFCCPFDGACCEVGSCRLTARARGVLAIAASCHAVASDLNAFFAAARTRAFASSAPDSAAWVFSLLRATISSKACCKKASPICSSTSLCTAIGAVSAGGAAMGGTCSGGACGAACCGGAA